MSSKAGNLWGGRRRRRRLYGAYRGDDSEDAWASSLPMAVFGVLMMMMMMASGGVGGARPGPGPGPVPVPVPRAAAAAGGHRPSLEYYVHVDLGGPSIARLAGALNQSLSAGFGEVDVFDLNITSGRDPHALPPLGFVRGFTVQTSYTSTSRNVEVEVISYNDGFGLNGTISLQGLILLAPNEIAIVGGTGSFRGVRGYALIDLVSNNLPLLLYHHSLFFL